MYFRVLKDLLDYLNNWKQNLIKNIIKEDNFLTKQTSEGLRVAINSTIELVNYIINDCGFAYVLTNKFNQDCLEVPITIFIKYFLSLVIRYLPNFILCFLIFFRNFSVS